MDDKAPFLQKVFLFLIAFEVFLTLIFELDELLNILMFLSFEISQRKKPEKSYHFLLNTRLMKGCDLCCFRVLKILPLCLSDCLKIRGPFLIILSNNND